MCGREAVVEVWVVAATVTQRAELCPGGARVARLSLSQIHH